MSLGVPAGARTEGAKLGCLASLFLLSPKSNPLDGHPLELKQRSPRCIGKHPEREKRECGVMNSGDL